MIKVLATGIMAENNFGSPSIMHGLECLLNRLYGNDYHLTLIQPTKVNSFAVSDFKMDVRYYKYNIRKLLIYAWLFKLLRFKSNNVEGQIISLISESDIVVDLFGIRFCDNFNKAQTGSKLKYILKAIGMFPFEYIAKIIGKKTVKNTASFGPMKYRGNQLTANYACEHIFSLVSAREKMSYDALKNDAKVKKEVLLSPDIANLFSLDKSVDTKGTIGISVSHQIIKQWSSTQGYVDCIAALCRHVISHYKKAVVLIPNEYVPGKGENDIDVAKRIQEKLHEDNILVEVPDVNSMTSTQLKYEIASCEVMVASRYHACVASLSAGVPLLILGWHYKYQELAELYGQEKWILSSKNCTIESLIKTFDDFYNQKEVIRKELKDSYKLVEQKVIETGEKLFSLNK